MCPNKLHQDGFFSFMGGGGDERMWNGRLGGGVVVGEMLEMLTFDLFSI